MCFGHLNATAKGVPSCLAPTEAQLEHLSSFRGAPGPGCRIEHCPPASPGGWGQPGLSSVIVRVLSLIEVYNFQSLDRARIPLGKFTVVTGPTGAGKSGLLRALRLLVFNAPGTAYIRQGSSVCKVATGDQDSGWAISIERRTTRGKDAYRIAHEGPEGHGVAEYTKLGGGVPEDVSGILALTELNFASQFDRPYLLDETGTAIARTLGKLTNVTVVLRAAQEAGRLRKEVTRDLKGAEARLAALEEQAQGFAGLKERREAISKAEARVVSVQLIEQNLEKLRALCTRLDAAHVVLTTAAEVAESWTVPSLEKLDALEARYARARMLADDLLEQGQTVKLWNARASAEARLEEDLHQAIHAVLVAAGQCPLCGQLVV